jgi:hypothetical protein
MIRKEDNIKRYLKEKWREIPGPAELRLPSNRHFEFEAAA